MSMISFFPWFTVEEDCTVGDFELLRYMRGEKPLGPQTADQDAADKILAHYFSHPAHPVTSATILRFKGGGVFDELADTQRSAVFAFSELLSLAGLAEREYFTQFGRYCNRDHFRVVVQEFSDPQAGAAITTRRRDGQSSNYISGAVYRVDKPDHVLLGLLDARIDLTLLNSMWAAREMNDWSRIGESIVSFNLANTDNQDMSPHIEALLLIGAFERLLECRGGNERRLATRFSACLRPSLDMSPGACARLAFPELHSSLQKSHTVREAWVRDFLRVRGDLAHGRIHPRYQAIWSLREHLLLSSYVFPLLVRSELAKTRLYSITKEDQFEIDLFERLACEKLFQPSGDRSDGASWPWNKVFEQARSERIHRDILNDLKKMGYSTEE